MNDGMTWAIVLATFLGPVAAVAVTLWWDHRRRKLYRQQQTFRTLMANRGAPVSAEFVGAINTVEVDFYGVTPVQTAWSDFINHLNNHPGNEAGAIALTAWEDGRRDKLAILLARMARAIGITKSEIEIRRGGYVPENWAKREARQTAAQDWIVDLTSGKRALPVKIVED